LGVAEAWQDKSETALSSMIADDIPLLFRGKSSVIMDAVPLEQHQTHDHDGEGAGQGHDHRVLTLSVPAGLGSATNPVRCCLLPEPGLELWFIIALYLLHEQDMLDE
jgi:hypothetical protein